MIHQHDLSWDADEKRWHCTRCERTSLYASKSDAAMELGQYGCVKKPVGE
jgi:hypothetical protein